MAAYAAFLRGINVGGNNPVKMHDLKKAFESLKFDDVKTLLASGNVLFQAPKADNDALSKAIEQKLAKTFGRPIGVLVRSLEELQKLEKADPFQKVTVTPQTRLYVTFLSEKPKTKLKLPHAPGDGSFTIIRVTDHDACGVVTLSSSTGTTDAMKILEKAFGKKITTRSWNTVGKVVKALE